MKKVLCFIVILLSLALVAGCGKTPQNPPEKTAPSAAKAPASTKSQAKTDILRDVQALEQFQKDVKEKFGDDFKIFRGTFGGSVHVSKSSITFEVVDASNTKNVDHYTWEPGTGFKNPQPVKVRTIGAGSSKPIEDFAEYQVSFKEVNFAAIPAFVAATEKQAKEQQLEGLSPVSSVSIKNTDGKRIFSASISASRKDIECLGDSKTGEITKFKVK